MMRTAALYDVHGNLPALEAVLADVRSARVEQIIIGGDVLPGPMPRESLDLLHQLEPPVRCLFGNGETAVRAEAAGEVSKTPAAFRTCVQWCARQLRPEHRQWIETWPATLKQSISGLGTVLFCHATPRDDSEIFTKTTPEDALRPIVELPGVDVVVCGHTHMPFDRTIGRARVVNAGSVGMPFGTPGAHWLLLGPGVTFQRTDYDLEDAAARIRRTDYPQAEQFAADSVLNPPSEDEMLAKLSAAAIGTR